MEESWTFYRSALPPLFLSVTVVIGLLILVGNILLLLTFKRMPKIKTMHAFMIGLAAADLLTVALYSVSMVIIGAGGIWMSDSMCRWYGVSSTTVTGMTTWVQSGLCIERSLAILRPVSHRNFSKSKYWKHIIASIVVMDLVCPFTICAMVMSSGVVQFKFFPYLPGCVFVVDRNMIASIFTAYLVIPFTIQVVTHSLVLYRVSKLQSASRAKLLKTMKTIALTLALYYMCWVPFVIQVTWKTAGKSGYPPALVTVSASFLMTNSCMSFVIYYTTLPEFKKTFHSLLVEVKKCAAVTNNNALRVYPTPTTTQ